MAAFRLFSKLDTFNGLTGQLVENGYLTFCLAGTTTPTNVYGSIDLDPNNGSTVDLDSSGRPDVDVWGDGDVSYFVELFDADDVKQGEVDNVGIPGGAVESLPTLLPNGFLTNDGGVLSWVSIREVPDPTGQADKVLSTDGTVLTWVAQAEPPAPATPADIDVQSASFRAADTGTPATSFFMQQGSGSAVASGSHTTSASVVFATPFLATPKVFFQATGGGVTGDGYQPILSRTAVSTTGFTVGVNINEGGTGGGTNISAAVAFDWVAFGTITTP